MTDLVPDRIQPLNVRGRGEDAHYVLYWVQQSQRARHNPALEQALRHANEEGLPLLVVYGLMDDYPEANLRHYTFMLEGLRETEQRLAERGLRMVVRHGRPFRGTKLDPGGVEASDDGAVNQVQHEGGDEVLGWQPTQTLGALQRCELIEEALP